MLNALAKIDIVNVPYRGAALVLNDVLAGQIPMGWAAPTAVMPHVATGKVKIVGVASAQRPASLPNVTPIADSVPGFDLDIWFGVSAPAKTPPDVLARLAKEIAEICQQPDVKERIAKTGLSAAYLDGAKFGELIRVDHERFGKIIRDAGLKPN
jgi:tripartite-type tricarboxylate transporter receptor subunit TctC